MSRRKDRESASEQRLALRKETLRRLTVSDRDLQQIAGGTETSLSRGRPTTIRGGA